MRQIFSIRFFMAVGAVVGLFFLLTTIFAAREVIDGADSGASGPEPHRIDFVDRVFASRNTDFGLDDDGRAADDTELIIDGSRSLHIVTGTPGEIHCDRLVQIGACAVVADLLGEGVVWFALVPMGAGGTVDFPAIDVLADGRATLVNGWQLPYAPILDRRCRDENGDDVAFDSYREFREVLGDDFTSVYSIASRRLEAVVCHVKVPYAPEIVPATSVPSSSAPSVPVTTVATGTGSRGDDQAPSTTIP